MITVEQILTASEESAVDWSQFGPSVLATVIGFCLAIVFQQFVYELLKNKILNNIKAKNIVIDIKKELERIAEVLHSLNNGIIYVDPIKIPVWEGILNTNEFELLLRFKKAKFLKRVTDDKDLIKKYGKENLKNLNFNLYDIIFSVYGIVQEYNKWWYIYSENYAEALASNGDKDKLEPIKDCINKIRDIMLKPTLDNKKELGESIVILVNLIECIVEDKEHKNKNLNFELDCLFDANRI